MNGTVSESPGESVDDTPEVPLSEPRAAALEALRVAFTTAELEWTEIGRTSLLVDLPGEKKLRTTCRFDVGTHALEVHAFVCRRPDENFDAVYRWMLERNMKMYAVAFALDGMGDIYLDARLPLAAATQEELDRLLGSVLEYADTSFNTILELGFASSIRKEWEWRVSRGESTRNLEAFIAPLGLGRPSDQPSDQPTG